MKWHTELISLLNRNKLAVDGWLTQVTQVQMAAGLPSNDPLSDHDSDDQDGSDDVDDFDNDPYENLEPPLEFIPADSASVLINDLLVEAEDVTAVWSTTPRVKGKKVFKPRIPPGNKVDVSLMEPVELFRLHFQEAQDLWMRETNIYARQFVPVWVYFHLSLF